VTDGGPVRQWLKYGRHQNIKDRLVEDRVADADQTDDDVA